MVNYGPYSHPASSNVFRRLAPILTFHALCTLQCIARNYPGAYLIPHFAEGLQLHQSTETLYVNPNHHFILIYY
jgi:hypothetical protein